MSYEDQVSNDRPDNAPRRIQSNEGSIGETFTIKAVTQVYELSTIDLQKLLAKELQVPMHRITIVDMKRDVSSPMDRDITYAFAGIRVTVKAP